jgi:hypothetical protein
MWGWLGKGARGSMIAWTARRRLNASEHKRAKNLSKGKIIVQITGVRETIVPFRVWIISPRLLPAQIRLQ